MPSSNDFACLEFFQKRIFFLSMISVNLSSDAKKSKQITGYSDFCANTSIFFSVFIKILAIIRLRVSGEMAKLTRFFLDVSCFCSLTNLVIWFVYRKWPKFKQLWEKRPTPQCSRRVWWTYKWIQYGAWFGSHRAQQFSFKLWADFFLKRQPHWKPRCVTNSYYYVSKVRLVLIRRFNFYYAYHEILVQNCT